MPENCGLQATAETQEKEKLCLFWFFVYDDLVCSLQEPRVFKRGPKNDTDTNDWNMAQIDYLRHRFEGVTEVSAVARPRCQEVLTVEWSERLFTRTASRKAAC